MDIYIASRNDTRRSDGKTVEKVFEVFQAHSATYRSRLSNAIFGGHDDRETAPLLLRGVPRAARAQRLARSRSTEDYDRGDKLSNYKQLPSLQAVLIVSHRAHRVTIVEHTEASS